ncbi:MAG: carboxypeptidase-like regulatory domain-containing protein [Bacteroidetes bacterium]|nr:carboxypeptidase-like regulatory domain-containing protein [Bacteroidota bacterium]
MKFKLGLLFFMLLIAGLVNGQTIIHGEVKDASNDEFLENVNVRNIYTLKGMTIQKDGKFSIEVKKGQLIEFTKIGYQTIRIRIESEKEPAYYKLVMEKAPVMLREVDIRGKPLDFVKDSVRYRETYDLVLRKEKREDVDMRSMPLAMLSKKNRQEWAFQEMYEQWEQEKYIDFVFNQKLVARITYLKDEELKIFMKKFRPSYEFLRNASDYEYLDYIKSCYFLFRKK